MKCFRHPDVDAVALCKQCCKALCAACAVEGQGGTSCGGNCAEEVELQHNLLRAAKPSLGSAAAAITRTAYFLLVCGAAMLVLGLVDDSTFATTMGAVFLVFGLVAIRTARKFPRP
jgi:hypothetical protein